MTGEYSCLRSREMSSRLAKRVGSCSEWPYSLRISEAENPDHRAQPGLFSGSVAQRFGMHMLLRCTLHFRLWGKETGLLPSPPAPLGVGSELRGLSAHQEPAGEVSAYGGMLGL